MTAGSKARAIAVLTVVCLVASAASLEAGGKKLRGTWQSLSVLPPTAVLGNSEPMLMPELDTFTACGAVLTSSAASVMPLRTDQGRFLGSVGLGQGTYKFKGNRFVMTQWRFLMNVESGEPLGYLRIINEFTLAGKKAGQGQFQAELMMLDRETPYTSDGEPIVIAGDFQMEQLQVQELP